MMSDACMAREVSVHDVADISGRPAGPPAAAAQGAMQNVAAHRPTNHVDVCACVPSLDTRACMSMSMSSSSSSVACCKHSALVNSELEVVLIVLVHQVPCYLSTLTANKPLTCQSFEMAKVCDNIVIILLA
jgi:hypothetical protein